MNVYLDILEPIIVEYLSKMGIKEKLIEQIRKRLLKLRKDILSLNKDSEECKFLGFVHPRYKSSQIQVEATGDHFFFEIPEPYKSELEDKSFKFYSHTRPETNYHQELKEFISKEYPEITHINDFINDCIKTTANYFLQALRNGASKHNNLINGIQSVVESEDYEQLDIYTFETDYFTYNCMMEIYRQLRKRKNRFIVESFEDIERLKWFTSSCGGGGFVILDYYDHEYLLVSKRSKTAACPQYWHFSFDETFDVRDTTGIATNLSIKQCLEKALQEEVFIFQEEDNNKRNVTPGLIVAGMIQNEMRFEFELFINVYVHLNNKCDFQEIIDNYNVAPDAENENSEMYIIPASKVSAFLRDRKKVTPESRLLCKAYEVSNKFIYKILNRI